MNFIDTNFKFYHKCIFWIVIDFMKPDYNDNFNLGNKMGGEMNYQQNNVHIKKKIMKWQFKYFLIKFERILECKFSKTMSKKWMFLQKCSVRKHIFSKIRLTKNIDPFLQKIGRFNNNYENPGWKINFSNEIFFIKRVQ